MSNNNNNNNNNRDNSNDIDIDSVNNKKQKLKHNNEFDIINLSDQTDDQLKGIANSMGISIKQGTEKNDIIEHIRQVYTRIQQSISKQEYESNLNSFNKGVIECTIKEGIDPSEWLFWKVFRNKFIFRTIMSNMDTESTLPYNSLINVQTLIKWDQLDILRDKVIRSQYLTFNECKSFGGKVQNKGEFGYNYTFISIFESINEDNEQDRLFYKHLFKNYSHYSTLLSNIGLVKWSKTLNDIQDDRNTLVNQLIKIKCIPAIQVLIQEYQYKPSLDNLETILSIDNLELFKLFLQPQFNLQDQLSKINHNVYNIKILNHCYNEKLINNQELELGIHGTVDNIKFEVLTLKSLIAIVKLILKCTNEKSNFQVEVESFSNNLSKSELKSLLSDKSNQIESKREMIKKLLQLYYSFSNIYSYRFYHIYFSNYGDEDLYRYDYEDCSDDEDGKYIDICGMDLQDIVQLVISTFRFANHKLLYKMLLRDKHSVYLGFDLLEPEFLFSHCQNKEKQMEFINFIIGKGSCYYDTERFLGLVLNNDDLCQIKLVMEGMSSFDWDYPQLYLIPFYTRSTNVLDWLFENHSYLFCEKSIWHFRNIELLQHFETLHKQKCMHENIESHLIDIGVESCLYEYVNDDVLKYIFKQGSTKFNYNIYDYSNIGIFYLICQLYSSSGVN